MTNYRGYADRIPENISSVTNIVTTKNRDVTRLVTCLVALPLHQRPSQDAGCVPFVKNVVGPRNESELLLELMSQAAVLG